MIITKRILISIDLGSCQAIYSPNRDDVIIRIAKDKLINKCFSGCYIISIEKILKKGDVRIVDNKLDGTAYVDVQLEVKAIVFACGKEILFGQPIERIENNGIIILKGALAAGLIAASPREREITKLLSKKQEIPVIVQKAMYAPNYAHITIYGLPYVPEIPHNTYYRITSDLSNADTDNLEDLQSKIQEELELHSKLDKSMYKFFEDLMYPYKTQQKFEMSPLGSKFQPIDMKSVYQISDGYIVQPTEVKNALRIYHCKEKKLDGVFIVDSTLYAALFEILEQRYIYLLNLRGFVENYPEPKFSQMSAYWKEINKLKG